MDFLKKILSVHKTHDNKHLIVCFLGAALKINRAKLVLLCDKFMNLVNLSNSVNEDLKKYDIDTQIRENYSNVLEKIKEESQFRKINVIFLLNSTSCAKFSYDSLCENLLNNPKFNVKVLISCTIAFEQNEYERKHLKEKLVSNYNYFKAKGYDVDYAYDVQKDKFIDLAIFKPDIVFYTEPWEIAYVHDIETVSKFALTCFCIYGTSMHNGSYEYEEPFYRRLFKYFMDNYDAYDLMIQNGVNPDGLQVVGSIKLDAYLKPIDNSKIQWLSQNKKRVIYAPHHSFSSETILKYGTFDKNYKYFLDYAKNHQDIEFIFKPHPVLKKEVVRRGLMSEREIEHYFEQWKELPNASVYEVGDYYDMFRTSDLMITDCNSFLSEYLPTQKPVIHLISENSVGYNAYGLKIIGGYYKSSSNDETEKLLNSLLYDNNDPLLEKRLQIIDTSFCWNKSGAANEIIKSIENLLKGSKNN